MTAPRPGGGRVGRGAAGSAPPLRVEGIGWRRGDAVILDAVSCRAPAGAFTGLIGPNGSGKTTLLSMIARWQKPDTGTAYLGDAPVTAMRRKDLARVLAVVEQHSATELGLTVEQIVELGTIPRGPAGWARPPSGPDAVVEAALRQARVDHLRHRTWQTLSGGERQKTQLARALAQQPQVLLLDEPTNHLDAAASLELLSLVAGRGLTVVAAMHDLQLAAMFCDHLVVLHGGRVRAEGPPEQVLTVDLLAEVYGLDAELVPHPRTGRPMVVLCGTVEPEVPVAGR